MTKHKSSQDNETQSKSRRSDFGSYKMTDRDWEGLRFIAEMKFVRFDTLGEYWAPGFAPASREPLTPVRQYAVPRHKGGNHRGIPWPAEYTKRMNAVAQVVSRWESKMSYAETWQPFASQPKWVRITAAGLYELGLQWYEIPFPERERIRHDAEHNSHSHCINQVRVALARGDVSVPRHRWIGEREIEANLPLKEPGMTLPHKPDGYLELLDEGVWEIMRGDRSIERIPLMQGYRIGIEVELSRKSYDRLATHVLPSLLEHYDYVWYFCLQDAYQAVVSARRDYVQTDQERKRIRILKLYGDEKG